jgi:hypothetical protein
MRNLDKLVLLSTALLCPAEAAAQAGTGASDPVREFHNLTGGKPVWVRAEVKEPWMRNAFDDVARQISVRSGQISLDQYLQYARQQGANDTPADRVTFHVQYSVNEPPPADIESWSTGSVSDAAVSGARMRQRNAVATTRISLPPSMVTHDTNGDGQIALVEWKSTGGALAGFGRIDRNNDGLITPEEAGRDAQRTANVKPRR